jgi:hypothetical protein
VATLTCSVIAVDAGALVVPGERRLFDVHEQQLEQIIADKGQVRCSRRKAGGSRACTALCGSVFTNVFFKHEATKSAADKAFVVRVLPYLSAMQIVQAYRSSSAVSRVFSNVF